MTVDHIGAIVFPEHLFLRIIGRIAFPLYCYLLVLGVDSTRNPKNYFIRLLLFALLSQIPYSLALNRQPFERLNIFFTLSFSLLPLLKPILVIPSVLIAEFLNFDYRGYGILLTICMNVLKRNSETGIIAFFLLNIFYIFVYDVQIFSLLALLFILLYQHGYLNVQQSKGGSSGYSQWRKYLFYIYYPLHLTVLYLVKTHILTI